MAESIREIIQIQLEAVNKGFSRVMNTVNKNIAGMNKVLNTSNKQWRKFETQTGEVNRRMGGMNTTLGRTTAFIRKATSGFRGFRMEMLGVMFFGLAMTQMFSGMLRPAAEMLGIVGPAAGGPSGGTVDKRQTITTNYVAPKTTQREISGSTLYSHHISTAGMGTIKRGGG